jgi:hypothetical protein
VRGVGDLVKAGLSKLGIQQSGCGGCARRQTWLNRLTPGYRAPRVPASVNATRMLMTFPNGPVRSGLRWYRPRVSYPGRATGALFPFSSYPMAGGSSTIPFDGTQSDLAAKHGAATTGDTLIAPVGTFPWVGISSITKGITLMGAGIGQTIIIDARVGSGATRNVISIYIPSGAVTRVSGFTVQGDGAQTMVNDGFIILDGCSTTTANYRIDHNRFVDLRNDSIRAQGCVFGVVDHNVLDSSLSGIFMSANNLSWPRDGETCSGYLGDGSWHADLTPGLIRAHYLENNEINGPITNSTAYSVVDSNNGARTVVRYNTLMRAAIASHGTDGSNRLRGSRWIESYENDITLENARPGLEFGADWAAWYRGGSGVFHTNRITVNRSMGFNWLVKHANRRDTFTDGAPWFLCDGNVTHTWDGNTAGQTGYRCLDQPGAGTAVDWNEDPAPTTAAGNILEPIYVWNNAVNGVAENCGNFGCVSDNHVVEGRDIISGTARPGYTVTTLPNGHVTAYTYPHPLVTDTVVIPPTPVVLRTKIRK